MMDETKAASQFLRAVRGKRSQVAFSRRLGFRSNPAADWEAGRRVPTATLALQACAQRGIDVQAAFTRFHPASAQVLCTLDDAHVSAWLNTLRGSVPIESLARKLNRSRSSVSRWLSGHTRPQLTDFLLLVQSITGRCSDLVAELIDIELVPALLHDHRTRARAKGLAYEMPWTEAILRVIETAEYRNMDSHCQGWIAARLGITLAEEVACIAALEESGLLTRTDDHYVSGSLTVDTVASPHQMRQLKVHWAQVALRRLEQPHPKDIFSYNVMSVSEEALDEIRAVLRRTYREIRSIAATPQREEVVAQLNLQLLSFDDVAMP